MGNIKNKIRSINLKGERVFKFSNSIIKMVHMNILRLIIINLILTSQKLEKITKDF